MHLTHLIKAHQGLSLHLSYLLLTSTLAVQAQQGAWTWMSGPELFWPTSGTAVFGTQGVPSPTTFPGTGLNAAYWTDLEGKFWLFGGDGGASSADNNLWKYDPDINQWTWVKGAGSFDDLTTFQQAVFGIQGVPDDANTPLGNENGWLYHVAWTGQDGNLWLLESNVQTGNCATWKYTIATNQWTWMHGNTPVHYGTQGLASPQNNPGFFSDTGRGWVDDEGDLWFFDGMNGGVMWEYSMADNQWTWVTGTPNPAGSGVLSPNVFGLRGVFDPSNQPGSCFIHQSWKACDGTFYMFGPLQTYSTTEYSQYSVSVMWRFDPVIKQWAWVGGNTNPDPVPQYNAAYPATPSNFPQACTFAPNNVPSAPAAMVGRINAWTGHDGLLYGYHYSQGFLWCYDPSTDQFARVHGDLQPCCGVQGFLDNFGSVIGTLGVPDAANTPGLTGGPSWVDRQGNLWKFGATTDGSGIGPMMRYTIDPECSPPAILTQVDSITVVACGSYTDPLGRVYTESGDYTYTRTSVGGCTVQVALDLTIADATADMEIAFDPARQNSLNFFYDRSSAAPGSIVDLAWTVNGVAAGATDTISHLMTNAGTYTVCLRVTSDAGCTDTLCRSVEVLPHGGIAPNVFTPNGDASNPTLHFDWLQPSQLNHLQVFNRWGQIVYDQTGYRNDWDGGGLPEGVYYYVLRLNAQEVITSYVHLLR